MKLTGFLLLALLGVATANQHGGEVDVVYTINGIVTLEGHRCIFRDGELRMTGRLLNIGEQGDFTIEAGFANTESGQRIHIDGGQITAISLPSTDMQAIQNAIAGSGTTFDEFVQQTGTIPPQNGVFEIISGVVVVNEIYYEVDIGVVVVLSAYEFQPNVPGGVQPAVGQTQTISVTESYQTTTVVEPVVLSKYSTRDVFVTVTAPVYKTVDVTSTNFVKQTVYVTEEQVIRSQAAGNVVVNTIAVPSQTVIFVRDTSTNFLLQTIVAHAISTLQHVSTNFVFSTATINVPVTSSITQTITRTDVATVTATVTETVGSTIFTTQTVVITQAPVTQTSQRGY